MSTQRMFLPENLRPTRREPTPRPNRRGTLLTVAIVLAVSSLAFVLSLWTVNEVKVDGCDALPEAYSELEGRWVPGIRLSKIRRTVERWPGVAHAAVSLQLPSTLHIRATSDEVCGSFAVRVGWRGIACNGDPGTKLTSPIAPLLIGFSSDQPELRRGLAIARRFENGCGATVERVRRITPTDYELLLSRPNGSGLRHIVMARQDGGEAERWFFEAWLNGSAPAWSDLRLDDRIVVGGAA